MNITTITIGRRRCGKRRQGLYLEGGMDGSPEGTLNHFVLLDPPIYYPFKSRVPRLVNGDAVLNNLPTEKFWVGSSAEHEVKKNSNAWWADLFGMPATLRLKIGMCAGMTDEDRALETIASKIKNSGYLVDAFRKMALTGLDSDLPGLYSELHSTLISLLSENTVANLVKVQSIIWKMAHRTRPAKLETYLPIYREFLVCMGLYEDATALTSHFSKGEL